MPEPLIVCHFSTSNMSVGHLSIFGDFLSHFYPKYLSAVAMATGMCRDERSVDAWFCVTISKIGKFQQSR